MLSWADEMGVVVWVDEIRVVVWADEIGAVSIRVVVAPNWMGGTLILVLGSDGRDGRYTRGRGGRCARGHRLGGVVGGTVV